MKTLKISLIFLVALAIDSFTPGQHYALYISATTGLLSHQFQKDYVI